jgi:hypothetical protein
MASQPTANDQAQIRVIWEVNASHSGQPRPLVYAHLRQRLQESGIAPDEAFIDDVVNRISEGTLSAPAPE